MKTKIAIMTLSVIVVLILPVAVTAVLPGNIIYVDVDAIGANDGSSWADAYNYLQDGLAVASAKDTIKVAEGIYTPDLGGGNTPGDPNATFQLKNNVTIKGGYAGFGEPHPNKRKPKKYETVLSGDLNGNDDETTDLRDLLTDPNRAENSYSVVTGSNTNKTAILDGFIITGGNANGTGEWPYPTKRGAGMFNAYGSPTLINCTFYFNAALECGGGIYNWNGHPNLTGCKFIENAVYGIGSAVSQVVGGGMYNYDSNPILTDCLFIRCYSGRLGGGMHNIDSNPKLYNCVFVENEAMYHGGAIYNSGGNPILTNCTLNGNSVYRDGGAISNWETDSTMVNCVFSGNWVWNVGGAIHSQRSQLNLVNCTFAGNSAMIGRAVSFSSYSNPSTVNITNCILWDDGDEIWNDDGSTITITYSDVYGGWSDTGNIDADPLFVDPNGADEILGTADDNLRLLAGSPCIDAGDNSVVPAGIDVDRDGEPRFVDDPGTIDTGVGTPPIVDMGAYELQAVTTNHPPVADAGADQTVYAWIDGIADVTLDGSGSSDLDGDALTYTWTWIVDSNTHEATGVNPTIELPVGEHIIQLVVNDGITDSAPDEVVITVIGPLKKTNIFIFPTIIKRSPHDWPYILTLVRLIGIAKDEVDDEQPLLLYPGGGEAIFQQVFQHSTVPVRTSIFAFFNKQDLLDAVPENGKIYLTVVGQLKTGQYFYGSYRVRITD